MREEFVAGVEPGFTCPGNGKWLQWNASWFLSMFEKLLGQMWVHVSHLLALKRRPCNWNWLTVPMDQRAKICLLQRFVSARLHCLYRIVLSRILL